MWTACLGPETTEFWRCIDRDALGLLTFERGMSQSSGPTRYVSERKGRSAITSDPRHGLPEDRIAVPALQHENISGPGSGDGGGQPVPIRSVRHVKTARVVPVDVKGDDFAGGKTGVLPYTFWLADIPACWSGSLLPAPNCAATARFPGTGRYRAESPCPADRLSACRKPATCILKVCHTSPASGIQP